MEGRDQSADLSDYFFDESEFCSNNNSFCTSPAASDDIFSVLEAWESASGYNTPASKAAGSGGESCFEFRKSTAYNNNSNNSSPFGQESDEVAADQVEAGLPKCKRQKLNAASASASASAFAFEMEEGQQRMTHITVERNRRKQMNEHLSVLRSLMPCFYVKRGDQASIIGGVVDYINELQQLLQSLESKKQRKVYNEVLSPRLVSSPRPSSTLSPRKPPVSPRPGPSISPRTPQPSGAYKPWMQSQLHPPPPSPCNSSASSSINDAVNELVATSKSGLAEVEVKFAGPNLALKTVSNRVPGQAVKIVAALEELALEILHVSIGMVDGKMVNSFTIKIGIECQLSAEDLAQQIQQTFS
ncbi:hypothetical protein ABFS83_06G103300 [Erythranthe nasuta]